MKDRKPHTYLSQSDVALQIESLVQAIEHTDTPAFRITQSRSGYERVERTRLSRYFKYIGQMIDLFDDRVGYSYSEHLQAFEEACQDVGLELHPDGPICLNEKRTVYLDHHRSMNVLTARIRQLTRKRWYRRKRKDRLDLAEAQEGEIIEYMDWVVSRYSRTTIIRVDLYYLPEAQASQRIEDVFADLDVLVAKHRHQPIFDLLIGYIYSVEQGDRREGRGYHIHAAYFFNGNLVSHDVWKAIQIGALWKQVTRGRGYPHSCNHHKDEYGEKCGIGRIQRSDQSIRPNTLKAMLYMVKDDQHLRLKPMGARCLRKGQFRRLAVDA